MVYSKFDADADGPVSELVSEAGFLFDFAQALILWLFGNGIVLEQVS